MVTPMTNTPMPKWANHIPHQAAGMPRRRLLMGVPGRSLRRRRNSCTLAISTQAARVRPSTVRQVT